MGHSVYIFKVDLHVGTMRSFVMINTSTFLWLFDHLSVKKLILKDDEAKCYENIKI